MDEWVEKQKVMKIASYNRATTKCRGGDCCSRKGPPGLPLPIEM
jgi:hypothetical protein